MNIAIVGAGAVGGYFGAKMVQAGLSVTFLVREKRYEALRTQGLRIRSVHGDFQIEPSLARSAEELQAPDLAIVAVKAYHLDGVIPGLDRWVRDGSKVLPLLNGMEAVERLAASYGADNVLGGLNYVESTLDEAGAIVQTSAMQEIVFGPFHAKSAEFAQRVLQTLQICDFAVTLSPSIRAAVWEKYLFLTVLSGMTASARSPIGPILQDEMASGLLRDMLDELIALSAADGAALPEGIRTKILNRFEAVSAAMTSSMHRDLDKRLPLELESLQGYAVRLGAKYGIAMPCTRTIYSLLHPYRNGAPL